MRNAVKYTPQNTAVSIELRQTGDLYTVIVQDSGGGVPEADLARIFEPFYRVDDARSRAEGGHGLGLSIAHRAIVQHGGTIAAANNSPGLKVIITLPVSPHD